MDALCNALNTQRKMDSMSNPPLLHTFRSLFSTRSSVNNHVMMVDQCELPLIDLSCLTNECCKREIATAAADWGFFQVVNHGISKELLGAMRKLLLDVFRKPFESKVSERLLDFSEESYRWGTPTATSMQQLSWSEAYHIPLTPALESAHDSMRDTIDEFAKAMSRLASQLTKILAEELGCEGTYFMENSTSNTCFLRLNHYPPCKMPAEVFGLTPHTDSDFLTILYQDLVGGLQLMKGGKWNTVKPNPDALIINIGDLFQAWSNGVYKSVEHRVIAHPKLERFSAAYFLCPSYDTMVESPAKTSIYKKFTFGEYRQQVKEDVRLTGTKVGLTRFLV